MGKEALGIAAALSGSDQGSSGGVPNPYARFDPAMGRGYRIGNLQVVPALAGFPAFMGALNPPVILVNHGEVNEVKRWKVTLHVTDPEGNVPSMHGSGLRFSVLSKMENDLIPRRIFISVGNARVLYAPGRSLEVLGINPNAYALTAHWQIDEYTAGLAEWEDQDVFAALAVETVLSIPPFCLSFTVYAPGAAAPAPRLRGYGPTGIVVYDEVLSVPVSRAVECVPNLVYTIAPVGMNPQVHAIRYKCLG
jgi:hypothetical protein